MVLTVWTDVETVTLATLDSDGRNLPTKKQNKGEMEEVSLGASGDPVCGVTWESGRGHWERRPGRLFTVKWSEGSLTVPPEGGGCAGPPKMKHLMSGGFTLPEHPHAPHVYPDLSCQV